MLLELSSKEVGVSRLSREAVPVLGKHHRHAACSHQVPHLVHTGSLKARPTLSGVLDLLEDLVALSCGVLPQSL